MLFPNHPQPSTRQGFIPCRYCDPDGMGVAELDRAWRRMKSADELSGYRQLIGDEDDAGDASDVRSDDGFGDGDV